MLSAIGIAAKSLSETLEFYKLLGLNFKEFGEGHYEATLANGTRIMIDSFELLKKINPDWREPGVSGITLCFSQTSPTQVDTLFHSLKDAGHEVEKEPWDAFWGQRYASILDPNGNQIDIFAELDK